MEQTQLQTIRIGWQVPWATQGQIVQVMKQTNVLELNGVQGEFVGFAFGAPLNEAALAGDVDVALTADQPAATLLSKTDEFEIVARLMYNRVSVYVPPDSPIQTMADMKGRTLALPFGAAVQREALRGLRDAGLDPAVDVEVVNLDLSEQAALVASSEGDRFGAFDALGGFDPTPAIFEANGLIRMVQTSNVVAVVMMRKSLIEDGAAGPAFLRAFAQSWLYFARNQELVNDWFKADAKFEFDGQAPLEISASVEPNVTASSIDDIRVTFNEEDLAVMQQAADFLFENDLITEPVTMSDHVTTETAEEQAASITEADMDLIERS